MVLLSPPSRNPFLFRGPIPTNRWSDIAFWSLVAIPSYSEVLFLLAIKTSLLIGSPQVAIPSYSEVLFLLGKISLMRIWPSGKSQSLLIQRSYSYVEDDKKPEEEIPVAIPSYSEVLFLRFHSQGSEAKRWGRNPFLFRGPIPTEEDERLRELAACRNPFLFRGPIPTGKRGKKWLTLMKSQSLLIQRSYSYFSRLWVTLSPRVAIPSYSEVLFLLLHLVLSRPCSRSQSLLIQRSYSYLRGQSCRILATYQRSQSLLIQRSYSYPEPL